MYSSRSEHDYSVNCYSPDGRIYQLEYANEAVKLGSTSIGIQTSEGVVLAAEKRLHSKLLEPASVSKIFEIDHHIGTVLSGMVGDARILIEHARVESQNHRFTYNQPMPVESCALSTCDLSLQFGEGRKKKMLSRPFGVSLLIGGVGDTGPELWVTDPTGTYTKYEAKAIGQGAEAANTMLVEQYHRRMTIKDAVRLAISILKAVMEDKATKLNMDVAVVAVPPAGQPVKLKLLSTDELEAELGGVAGSAAGAAAAGGGGGDAASS